MIVGFLRVNYDEGDASTYEGLELSLTDYETTEESKHSYNSGNLRKDFHDFIKYIKDVENIYRINFSSSYDHFWMDGGDKTYKEIHVNENLEFQDKEDENTFRIILRHDDTYKNFKEYKLDNEL